MFRRSNKLPQRKVFSFSVAEMIEDINNVSGDSAQREKLYKCIDDKQPPHENRFAKIEEFLNSTENLETSAVTLEELCDELVAVEKQLVSGASHISDLVAAINNKTT